MNANELLLFLTRDQIKATFGAARELPTEKLDWKPAPGARSALDQLQEIATAIDFNWDVYINRKVEWSEEKSERWKQTRSQYTDLDQLEQMALAGADRLESLLGQLDPSDYRAPVQVPWGEATMAECLAYHYWNSAYHHGQIVYIASLLEHPG